MIYNSQKKTIALILASMVSIAGSFASENYKNSLMGIEFESSTNGAINMVVSMKHNYSGNVTPTKRDANTYVLMLPEIDSKAQTPNFSNTSGISSVNIRTMPYSASAKGYTKVTIKTNTYITLSAQSKIYIPTEQTETNALPNNETPKEKSDEQNTQSTKENVTPENNNTSQNNNEISQPTNNITTENNNTSVSNIPVSNDFLQQQTVPIKQKNKTNKNSYELSLLILSFFLIIIMSVWFMFRGKNKLQEIAGEKIDVDVNDNLKNTTKKTSLSEIKKTINTIDSTVPKYSSLQNFGRESNQGTNNKVVIEKTDIIDLDELFQQDVKNIAQNEADTELYDYLESISINAEENKPELDTNSQSKINKNNVTKHTDFVNTDIYNKTLNNSNLKFSNNDIKKMNQLLALEISDETIETLQDEKITNPIREIISPQKKAENLITDYTIKQDIIFTPKDIEILYKLISVEIDSDFITDLRTHVDTAQQTQRNITQRKKVSVNNTKISPITNANKEQNTIYDDINKLEVSGLPDLQKALKQSELYRTEKITHKIEVPSSTFSEQEIDNMGTLKVSGLPDLQDVLKHPELYDNVPIDEAISKDDYSASNTPISTSDYTEYTTHNDLDILKVSGLPNLQEALEHPSENITPVRETNDFDISENNEYNAENDNSNTKNGITTLKVSGLPDLQDALKHPELYENKKPAHDVDENKLINNLLNVKMKPFSEGQKFEVLNETPEINTVIENNSTITLDPAPIVEKQTVAENFSINTKQEINNDTKKCIIEGSSYNILQTIPFNEVLGCHLAKNEQGFYILSYIKDKISLIKYYETVTTAKMQARLNEKLPDGTSRILIKVGTNKFIIDVTDNNINFVMDLC